MKRPQDMTPQERYNAILGESCETIFILLKHRIGQLEEMPEAERKTYQDFCDTALTVLRSFITGEPDIEAMETLNGKITQRGAAEHGNNGRTAGGFRGSAAGRTFRP